MQMFAHEFKAALLERLSAIPEVVQVNFLQYWGEQIYFVVLDPRNDATEQAASAALISLLAELGSRAPRTRLRFSQAGEHLPSSATLYHKAEAITSPT